MEVNFGKDKMLALTEDKYLVVEDGKDITRYVAWCMICQMAKGH